MEVASGLGQNLWGETARGKETYLFKCTIYHALIEYSSGISSDLHKEDQRACDRHLELTAPALCLPSSTASCKLLAFNEAKCWPLLLSHSGSPAPCSASPNGLSLLSMLCPRLISALCCPQVAYHLNFHLYETQRRYSLSKRLVNLANYCSEILIC